MRCVKQGSRTEPTMKSDREKSSDVPPRREENDGGSTRQAAWHAPKDLNGDLLERSPLFAPLTLQQRSMIASLARHRDVQSGVWLFNQGDPGDTLYVIEHGRVEISIFGANGRRLVLNLLGARDVFGEIALLDGGERTASARVRSQARFAVIQRRDLQDLVRRDADIADALLRMLCARLRWVSAQFEDRALLPVPARLARRLGPDGFVPKSGADDAQENRTGRPGGVGILAMSQADLADSIGATREHVNRILTEWQAAGWVELGRGRLSVKDGAALEALIAATIRNPRT